MRTERPVLIPLPKVYIPLPNSTSGIHHKLIKHTPNPPKTKPHNFALTPPPLPIESPPSNKLLISALGQSGFFEASGLSRSQAHFRTNSSSNSPSSICTIYLPSTGKNFQPWKFPHVAM